MKKNFKIGIAVLAVTIIAGTLLSRRKKSCSQKECPCCSHHGIHSLHCENKMENKEVLERVQHIIENKLEFLKQKIAGMS